MEAASAAAQPAGPCFQFAQRGACAYAERCRFAHGGGDDPAARRAAAGCAPDAPRAGPASGASCTAAAPAGASGDAAAAWRERNERAPSRVVLFVAGLPQCLASGAVKRPLTALCRPFRPSAVRLGVTHEGHTRGWAHVSLPAAAADDCIAALDGAALLVPGATSADSVAAVLRCARVTDKRDALFPYLSREQRLALRLDSVALYSVADGVTAERTAGVLAALLARAPGCGDATWRAVDGCACAGGSALALARCAAVAAVTAVELDPGRAAALAHNAAVCGLSERITVRCGDFTAPPESSAPASATAAVPDDVVFLDPPWGGTAYSATSQIGADALGLSGVPLAALVETARGRGAGAVALGTPRNYDDVALARAATAARRGEAVSADRPLPFRLEFGARILLIILFPADAASAASPPLRSRFAFPTSLLDDLVATLRSWNASHGAEHHPRFFDWEKDRWVPLSRWHGARPVQPPPPPPCADTAA